MPDRLDTVLDRLIEVVHPQPDLATLTLDVSHSGILPEEARLFLKDRALRSIDSDLAVRVQHYVESRLAPGTNGLYLAAGPDLWEPVELLVRLPNFLHVGRAPYLPPLAAAIARAPRVLVARFDERSARLQSLELGVWSDVDEWSPFLVERDAERFLTGRTITSPARHLHGRTGVGGANRDRFEQTLEAETARMLEDVARRIGALHREAPVAAVFVFSERERFAEFHGHLPVALRPAAEPLGAAPRDEQALRRRIESRLAEKVLERGQAEVREFEERRAQNHLVAASPDEVMAHRTTGHLARVFVDPADPVPGSECLGCGGFRAGAAAACPTCGGATSPTSLTQAIVAHARAHPPLSITFVTGAGWLQSLGGMAGLLSQKGVRGKRP